MRDYNPDKRFDNCIHAATFQHMKMVGIPSQL